MKKPFLEAGKIVNTHGVRGELRITPWADSADFLRRFPALYVDGTPRRVLQSRVHRRQLIVKLEGVDDVNAAMALKNRVVCIDRNDAALPEGRHFVQDLLGMRVVDAVSGAAVGTLRERLELPQGGVWVIAGETEHLIPDVPEFIRDIDEDAGVMTVRLIEGM